MGAANQVKIRHPKPHVKTDKIIAASASQKCRIVLFNLFGRDKRAFIISERVVHTKMFPAKREIGSSVFSYTSCYIFLAVAHIIVIWVLPIFPTQDGPCHFYNLTILNDLMEGKFRWSDFYFYQFKIIPNMGFHSIAFPLMKIFSPLITEKIFLTTYVILLSGSFAFFFSSFSRPIFPLSFLFFPVIFNYTLMMGNYSFTISIPLLLLAVAVQWKYRNNSTITTTIIATLTGVILFLSHLVAFGIFIICLVNICICSLNKKNVDLNNILRKISIVLPCVVILLSYLMFNRDIYLSNLSISGEASSQLDIAGVFTRLTNLLSELAFFGTYTFSKWQLVPCAMFLAIVIILIFESLRKAIKKSKRGNIFENSEKYLFLNLTFLIIIYFVAPFRWGAGSCFNQRLPWVILLFLLPVLNISGRDTLDKLKVLIMLIAILFLAVNSIVFFNEADKIKNVLSGLEIKMPEGSCLVTYKRIIPQWSRVDCQRHIASYYGMKKKCVDAGNYQASSDLFWVKFKDDLPRMPKIYEIECTPNKIDWSIFRSIDYIIGVDLGSDDIVLVGKYFENIYEKGDLSIWERLP